MKIIFTEKAPATVGPYSQAVISHEFVFCSGQISQDAQTGKILPGSVAEQTKNALQNLACVLEKAGSDLDHVVKCNVYLSNADTFDEMNDAYSAFFRRACPARLTVEVGHIFGGLGVEIDAIAEII